MKKIVILGYTPVRLDFYRRLLSDLLPGEVQIETTLLSELQTSILDADLAVLTSPYFTPYIKQHLPHVSSVLLAYYTLEKNDLQEIQRMERTGPISVVGDGSLVDSNRKMMLLEKLGIRRGSMSVWYPGMETKKLCRNVVLFGQATVPEPERHTLLHIEQSCFSVSTILEIFCGLGMPELATGPAFEEYYHRMCTQMLLDPTTLADSHEELLAELVHEGLLLLSGNNVIEYCDRYVENVVGLPHENLIGKNLLDIFPALSAFLSEGVEGFQERVITFRGRQYIININTISRHQERIGYVRISNYWEQENRQNNLRRQLMRKRHVAKYTFDNILGVSEGISATRKIAQRIAGSRANVLITGESGVGKELFAQAIHNGSDRCQKPFVAANCGAFVETLLESELFGYESGAFTGAKKEGKPGLFEQAHTGTLFLDEIGDMPLHLQVRLLRVLQEREVTRVGGDTVIPVDVRIIAATNKDLRKMIQNGEFRSDLYYRLNVLSLDIPPLRERREDILCLFRALQEDNAYQFSLAPETEKALTAYPFYGNVRELANCVEYLANLGLSEIFPQDLPAYIRHDFRIEEDGLRMEGRLEEDTLERRMLRGIYQFNSAGLGAGRRTLREELHRQGCPVTETAVRDGIERLSRKGLITVSRGRRGIELTEAGRRFLMGEW